MSCFRGSIPVSFISLIKRVESVPIKAHPISEALKFPPNDLQIRTRDSEIANADK